jgi:hypothetical protein
MSEVVLETKDVGNCQVHVVIVTAEHQKYTERIETIRALSQVLVNWWWVKFNHGPTTAKQNHCKPVKPLHEVIWLTSYVF